jgi:hypothetical protein
VFAWDVDRLTCLRRQPCAKQNRATDGGNATFRPVLRLDGLRCEPADETSIREYATRYLNLTSVPGKSKVNRCRYLPFGKNGYIGTVNCGRSNRLPNPCGRLHGDWSAVGVRAAGMCTLVCRPCAVAGTGVRLSFVSGPSEAGPAVSRSAIDSTTGSRSANSCIESTCRAARHAAKKALGSQSDPLEHLGEK